MLKSNTIVHESLNTNLDFLLSRLFLLLGLQPSRIGFSLLKKAVVLYLDGMYRMHDIHLELKALYGNSIESSERNMRALIESACYHGDIVKINDVVGFTLFAENQALSTKEFIATICEYIVDPHVQAKLLMY